MGATVPAGPACPVCWCALEPPEPARAGVPRPATAVACLRCRAPHHADCIQFVGRCATFGCGGEEFEEYVPAPAGSLAVTLGPETPGPPAGPPAAAGGLRRGIGDRFVAAFRLLAASPGIVLPMIGLQVLIEVTPAAASLRGVVTLVTQAMLVVMLLARARGKQSSAREALALANQRGGRMLLCGMATALMVGVPLILGGVLLGMALDARTGGVAYLATLVGGGLALGAAFAVSVTFSLAGIVAAMGLEEEPDNALLRSARLVAVARGQVAASGLLAFLLPLGLSLALRSPFLLSILTSPMNLLMTVYWLLFYIEARRTLQQGYLPHAAPGFLPEAPRA